MLLDEHLTPGVPNYRLHACYRSHAHFATASTLTLRSSFNTTRLKVWDENLQAMTGFDHSMSESWTCRPVTVNNGSFDRGQIAVTQTISVCHRLRL